MEALTIHEAAATTGWSARMLRYIERVGLIEPERTDAGYRLYGAAELQRLRTLRELLDEYALGLSDVAVALRLRDERETREAVEHWLAARPERPEHIPAGDWLSWEQEKHSKLIAAATPTLMETG